MQSPHIPKGIETANAHEVAELLIAAQLEDQQAFLGRNDEFKRLQGSPKKWRSRFERNIRDSIFRRAQLTLTPPQFWLVQVTSARGGLPIKELDENLEQKLVIDPEQISDHLAEVLLNDKLPSDEEQKQWVKNQLVPHVKKMLEGAKPFRVLEKDKKTNRQWSRPIARVSQLSYPEHLDGRLLVFSDRKSSEGENGYQINIVEDLFTLLRQYEHILAGYSGINPLDPIDAEQIGQLPEHEQLRQLEDKIDSLRRFIDDHKGELRQNVAAQEWIYTDLNGVINRIKRWSNAHKKRAAARVSNSRHLSDIEGRYNPGANLAQLTGAINDIGKRVAEILSIEKSLVGQKSHLEKQLFKQRKQLDRLNDFFRDHPEFCEDIDSAEGIAAFLAAFEKSAIKKRNLKRSDFFAVQPFKAYQAPLMEQMKNLQRLKTAGQLDDQQLEEANEAIFKIYLLSKYWKYQRFLAGLTYRLRVHEHVDLTETKDKLYDISATFNKKNYRVHPHRHMPEFDAMFFAVEEKIQEISAFLEGKEKLTPEECDQLAKRIKALDMTGNLQATIQPETIEEAQSNIQRAVYNVLRSFS